MTDSEHQDGYAIVLNIANEAAIADPVFPVGCLVTPQRLAGAPRIFVGRDALAQKARDTFFGRPVKLIELALDPAVEFNALNQARALSLRD